MSKLLKRASVRIFSLAFAGCFVYVILCLINICFPPDLMKVELQLTSAQRIAKDSAGANINIPMMHLLNGKNEEHSTVNINSLHVEELTAFVSPESFGARLALLLPKLLWGLICSYSLLQLYLFLKEIRGNAFFSQKQTDRLRNMGGCMLAYVGLQYLCQSLLLPTFILDMEQAKWPSSMIVATVKKEEYLLWLLGGIIFIYLSIAFKRGELMEEEQKYIL